MGRKQLMWVWVQQQQQPCMLIDSPLCHTPPPPPHPSCPHTTTTTLTTPRVLKKNPELVEEFTDRAAALLHDKNQGVALSGVSLMLHITALDPVVAVERYRAHVPTLCKMLRNLLQVCWVWVFVCCLCLFVAVWCGCLCSEECLLVASVV